MKRFIKEDLKKNLFQNEAEKSNAYMNVEEGVDIEPINALLVEAEQHAKMRELIGPLNPHINVMHGSKLKVFIKRVVRKLSWWMIRPLVDSQNYYNELTNSISNGVRDSVCILKDTIIEQQRQIDRLNERLEKCLSDRSREKQQKEINELRQMLEGTLKGNEIEGIKKKLNDLSEEHVRFKKIEEQMTCKEETIFDYIDYEDFENTFRGSQQEIGNRIKRYLSYYKEGDNVVDLGCGRGEWLALLESKGVKATGIDKNAAFVKICGEKGLHVEQADFFEYLEQLPDAVLDGITAIQVIEHLSPVELARLVKICYKKVKFGGTVIFETQNPSVVSTMTGGFFVDPTHERPVHPLWIKYLMEKAMFTDIVLEYPEYAWVTAGSIPALEEDNENVKMFNDKIAYLNNLLYGSTDYTIIATK